MESYTVNENGERVLGGSRRPDGTVRKERRIRPGYTPQDEQPVYQSAGTLMRQNIPKCPGLDPSEAAGGSSGPKSKAAKKNEKRKAKKADGGAADGGAAAAAAPKQPAPKQPAPQQPQPQQQAAAASTPADGPAAVVDKQIKALSKKVRQCQALAARRSAGETISEQEAEKLAKMPGWQEEIKGLEHQLNQLLLSS